MAMTLLRDSLSTIRLTSLNFSGGFPFLVPTEYLGAEDQFVRTDESFDDFVGDCHFGGSTAAGGGESVQEDVGIYERGHCVRSA
jgi:hypothetical protein